MTTDDNDHIPFTKTMSEKISSEKKRTGISVQKLLIRAKDKPEGLNYSTVLSWLNGTAKTVNREHWAYAVARWASFPNSPRATIPFTSKMRKYAQGERLRTSTSGSKLLRGIKDRPKGLNPTVIDRCLSGKAKTVNKIHWDFICELWAALPDVEYIILDDKQKRELARLYNAGRYKICKKWNNRPDNLSVSVIETIINGGTNTLRREHYRYILNTLKTAYQEELNNPHIVLNDKQRKTLKSLYRGAKDNLESVLAQNSKEFPEGLTRRDIRKFSVVGRKKMLKSHYDFISEILQKAYKAPLERVDITADDYKKLLPFKNVYGLYERIFDKVPGAPQGLKPSIISSWWNTGRKTVEREYLEWVLQALEQIDWKDLVHEDISSRGRPV